MPAARYPALRAAASRVCSSIRSQQQRFHRHRLSLNVELWTFDGKATGPDPIPVEYWMEQLSDELAGQGLDQTDHGITQRHFPHVLLKPPLSNTFSTKIALLPAVDAATTEALPPFTKSAEPLRVANVRAEHSWLLRLWAVHPAPQVAFTLFLASSRGRVSNFY